jgi:hypothetical protein
VNAETVGALDEIRATFPDSVVETVVNADGSVWVTVSDLLIGEQWVPARSYVGFTIGFQYPYADCYPHYVDAALEKKDETPFGPGLHLSQRTPLGDEAVMVSRQNRHITEVPDTAATKLLKVLDWLRSQ